jgi:uncharacterized protein (DUF885 family)
MIGSTREARRAGSPAAAIAIARSREATPMKTPAPICVLITAALSFSSLSAQSQPAPSSADARLRALYTEEWNWRQQQLGRGAASDRFPRVDAALQQARLAYWTRTLATLDTIPVDQLSPEEQINAQIFRTSQRALASDVQSLTLTPQQIHDIGLKEVARIEAEMRATKDKANFTGTMAEFFTFLRTDPQFYAKTPRELLSYSAYVAKKADDKLAETIGFLPRRRHGIRPVPDAIAPIYTGGRGGLEACLMNTYNLPARPLYTLASLTLHECTPGHSFQAALALEGPERPAFRRGTSFSGYGEGWGLYTEWLGTVMGIYETPYEDMGRLTYEMWRACRLVIDTGIHQFGWTREQAMTYLRDRAALAEHEITTEIDRYIAWPGQALAYKLGELQIRRHRREAEEKLGARFDQRRFHDAILAIGSVPLPVLELHIERFIADESATAKE